MVVYHTISSNVKIIGYKNGIPVIPNSFIEKTLNMTPDTIKYVKTQGPNKKIKKGLMQIAKSS